MWHGDASFDRVECHAARCRRLDDHKWRIQEEPDRDAVSPKEEGRRAGQRRGDDAVMEEGTKRQLSECGRHMVFNIGGCMN